MLVLHAIMWSLYQAQLSSLCAYLARDCLPLPPTPTSMALPRGTLMVLAMRVTCSMACSPRQSQGLQHPLPIS